MGMYDHVRCEVPLPDDWRPRFPLQTKDFNHLFDMYLITSQGRLVVDGRDTDFHGVLNFYGADLNNEWHEYNAKFTDGNLVVIEAAPEAPWVRDILSLKGEDSQP